jgi:putative endonuclease
MYYIYILQSGREEKHYIGYSEDPWRRVTEHNTTPHDTYTSKHRPWMLVAVYEAGESRSGAMRIERLLKRQKTRAILQKLIKGEPLYGILARLVLPHLRDSLKNSFLRN